MFEVGDAVLCYHTPTDPEYYIDDDAFYDGERGTVKFVDHFSFLRYGIEFDEWNPERHDLDSPSTLGSLCELGHGYWLNEENLVLDKEECEEVDESSLMKILEGDEMCV